MGNTNEKYTVSLIAKTRAFVKSMANATKAMKMVGDMNRGIIKNLQKMSSAATKAGGKFNQTQQKMRNGVTETNKATEKGTKAWKKYFKVFAAGTGIVASFGLTMLALSRILKRVRIGAAIQVQARAFANLAASHGANAKKMLKDLREASKGTIDNIQIMTTASRAIMLGIAPSKLVRLMEIARASAKAMGTTVAGAFSDIALGIGRQSRLILDNLGIIVRVKAAYDRYAFSIGVTADALTDFERQQAFANEVIRFGEKTKSAVQANVEDMQDKLSQIDTVMKNISQTVNLHITKAFVVLFKVLEERGVISGILKMIEVNLPKAVEIATSLMITMILVAEKSFDSIVKKLKEGARISGKWAAVIIGLATVIGALAGQVAIPIPGFGAIIGALGGAAGMTLAISELNQTLDALSTSDGAKGTWLEDWVKIYEESAAKVSKISKGIGKVWEDALTPDQTQVKIAAVKLEGFNVAVEEGLTSAKDLINLWTQLKDPITAAQEEIVNAATSLGKMPKDAKELAAYILDGTKSMAKMPVDMSKFGEELEKAKATLEGLRAHTILIDLEIESTDEFNRGVKRAIGQMNRLLANPNLLKTRQSKSLAFEALFKGVVDRHFDLTPEVKAAFIALQKEFGKLKDIAETLPDSFSKGLNQWVDNYKDANNRMATMGVEAAKAISAGFETFFFDAVTGKLKTLQETFANFGTSILRSVSKALGDKATEEILGIFKISGNKAVDENTGALKDLSAEVKKNTAAQAAKLLQGSQQFTAAGIKNAPNPVTLAALKATGSLPPSVFNPGTSGTTPSAAAGAPAVNTPAVKAKTTAVTVSILDKVKKSMTDIYTKFSLFMGGLFKGIAGFFGGGSSSKSSSIVSGASGAISAIGSLSKEQDQAAGKAARGWLDKVRDSFKSGGKLGGIGNFFGKIGGSFKSGGKLEGVGGFLGGIGGMLGKIWPFAEGGITSLAGSLSGAMMTSKPTIAAISERGQREAIVPLDKFADLIQQPSITINAIDTKSFQQYVNENKEILLGAVNSVRSPQYTGQMARGPY